MPQAQARQPLLRRSNTLVVHADQLFEAIRAQTRVTGTLYAFCQHADLSAAIHQGKSFNYSEFFCKVRIDGGERRTSTAPPSLRPQWDECFDFPVAQTDTEAELTVEIWEQHAFGPDQFVARGASASIPPALGEVRVWYRKELELRSPAINGRVTMHVYYDPFPRLPIFQRRMLGAASAFSAGILLIIAQEVAWSRWRFDGAGSPFHKVASRGVSACLAIGAAGGLQSATFQFIVALLPVQGPMDRSAPELQPAVVLRHVEMLGWDIRCRCGQLLRSAVKPMRILGYGCLSGVLIMPWLSLYLQQHIEPIDEVLASDGLHLAALANFLGVVSLLLELGANYDLGLAAAKSAFQQRRPMRDDRLSSEAQLSWQPVWLAQNMRRFLLSMPGRMFRVCRHRRALSPAAVRRLMESEASANYA